MAAGDTYMADPADMSDEQLASWTENFRTQPPTMDYMAEHAWAGRVVAEHARRQAGPPNGNGYGGHLMEGGY